MQIFNARTQNLEDVTWSKASNGEIIAGFKDETFVKFPAGSTKQDIERLVIAHQEANEGQEVITPEMEEARAQAEASADELIKELNDNTMSESDKTNASEPTESSE